MSETTQFVKRSVSQSDPSPQPCRPLRERTAQRLKEAYLLERQRYASVTGQSVPSDDINPKFASCWLRTADVVIRLDCEPESYMHAQCASMLLPPYPHQMYGQAAIHKYSSYSNHRERSLRSSRELYQQLYQRWLNIAGRTGSPAAALAEVPGLPADLDGLICYCLADRLEDREGCERYAEAAARQYLVDRQLYDEVWGNDIPDRIRTWVSAYIRRVEER